MEIELRGMLRTIETLVCMRPAREGSYECDQKLLTKWKESERETRRCATSTRLEDAVRRKVRSCAARTCRTVKGKVWWKVKERRKSESQAAASNRSTTINHRLINLGNKTNPRSFLCCPVTSPGFSFLRQRSPGAATTARHGYAYAESPNNLIVLLADMLDRT